jgi:hypothetical protein
MKRERKVRKDAWTVRALDGPLFRTHSAGCEEDRSVLAALPSRAKEKAWATRETATSYNCCSQTQTKGPGCCQVRGSDDFQDLNPTNGFLASRRQLESQRLWPIPVQ